MSSTRELRRRIKSVKNTAQITKAMQMVAATKMRKAQNQALGGRPYNDNLSSSLSSLLPKINPEVHPLLQENNASEIGVLLLTTDKGLCGALNTNLIRVVNQNFGSKSEITFFTVGKKGRNFLVKTAKNLAADFENPEVVTFRQARQISKLLMDLFLEGQFKEIYMVYADFVSALRQEPRVKKLLPISLESLLSENGAEGVLENKETRNKKQETKHESEFLFEPNVDELLDFILIHNLQTKIYQALLETKASEHSARMLSMKNATDNAKELVSDLTLNYNQTRQTNITTELLEITSAAAAME